MIILIVTSVLCATVIILCIYFLIRLNIASNNRTIIIDAIHRYNRDMIVRGKFNNAIHYHDMESFDDTLFRLNDFGYTNILPKEKYELIKPYIKTK